jgi:hypothetical protein
VVEVEVSLYFPNEADHNSKPSSRLATVTMFQEWEHAVQTSGFTAAQKQEHFERFVVLSCRGI